MKTKASKATRPHSCFVPAIPQEQATAYFIKQNKASNDAQNNYVREFVSVVKFLTANSRTLTLDMVVREMRGLEIPYQTISELFTKYTDLMCQLGKLQKSDSVYDETLFVVC